MAAVEATREEVRRQRKEEKRKAKLAASGTQDSSTATVSAPLSDDIAPIREAKKDRKDKKDKKRKHDDLTVSRIDNDQDGTVLSEKNPDEKASKKRKTLEEVPRAEGAEQELKKSKKEKNKRHAADGGDAMDLDPTIAESIPEVVENEEKKKKKREKKEQKSVSEGGAAAQDDTISTTEQSTEKDKSLKEKKAKKSKTDKTSDDAGESADKSDKKSKKNKGSVSEPVAAVSTEKEEGTYVPNSFPDPRADMSLSEASFKGITYAYLFAERFNPSPKPVPSNPRVVKSAPLETVWKFSKARQNWLARHVWYDEEKDGVPERYVACAMNYLGSVKGGARDGLVKGCDIILNPQTAALLTKTEVPVTNQETGEAAPNKKVVFAEQPELTKETGGEGETQGKAVDPAEAKRVELRKKRAETLKAVLEKTEA